MHALISEMPSGYLDHTVFFDSPYMQFLNSSPTQAHIAVSDFPWWSYICISNMMLESVSRCIGACSPRHCPGYFESCILKLRELNAKTPYIAYACLHTHRHMYSILCSDKIRFLQLRIKWGVAKSCPGTHTGLQAPMSRCHEADIPLYLSADHSSSHSYGKYHSQQYQRYCNSNFECLSI